MKKQIILAAVVLISAGMLLTTGCKKEDATAPIVTLNGKATEQSILNATWTDAGATATDEEDGNLDVTVTGAVNKDLAGVYEITYSATDAAGNVGTSTRKVTVYNEAEAWAGTYPKASIVDSVFSDANHTTFQKKYTWLNDCKVTASTTVNNKLIIDPFSDYSTIGASEKIYGMVTGNTINIPSQTAHNIGISGTETHTFQGSGYKVTTSTGFKFKLNTSDTEASIGTVYDAAWFTR